MKWNQLFSHNTRRQEGTADSLLRLLAPSLLGMAVCVLTLCSLTWAWFNMAVGSSITGIQSSEVEVCLVNHNDDGTWSATPLVENENGTSNATTDAEGKIYFIARGTAANAYLKVECNSTATYYKLDLTSTSVTPGEEYPVYSVQVATSSKAVQVSLIWGTLPESSTPSETKAEQVQDITVSWGGTSTQSQFDLDGDEEPNTTPVIDPSADDPQPQPETPANGDTGDNTSDANNDDAQTPDGSTTGDANKEPDATGGNTSDTGDTGTTGDGSTSGSTDTGGDPDSSTEKGSAEKSDGDTTLDGSVVKAAAD